MLGGLQGALQAIKSRRRKIGGEFHPPRAGEWAICVILEMCTTFADAYDWKSTIKLPRGCGVECKQRDGHLSITTPT